MARSGRDGQRATTSVEQHLGPELAQEVAGRRGCPMNDIGCSTAGPLIILEVPGLPRARGTTRKKVVEDLHRRVDNMQDASASTG